MRIKNGFARSRTSLSKIARSPTTATTRSTTVADARSVVTSAAAARLSATARRNRWEQRARFTPVGDLPQANSIYDSSPHVRAVGRGDVVIARPMAIVRGADDRRAVGGVDAVAQRSDDPHERAGSDA